MKFYTEEGNWDLVGNNTPIFFIRDPIFVSTPVFGSLEIALSLHRLRTSFYITLFWFFFLKLSFPASFTLRKGIL